MLLGLGIVALAGSSLTWAWLAQGWIAWRPNRTSHHVMLTGLTATIPLVGLVLALTVTGRAFSATTAGSGAALTYILIGPVALFGKSLANGSWRFWRRTVLPFCLATAAMWMILGSTGHFWPLDGQFLITLFALGTWLVHLETTAIASAPSQISASPHDPVTPDNQGRPTGDPDGHAGSGRGITILVSLAGMGMLLLAMRVLAAEQSYRASYLVPVLGAVTCGGPILLAIRADEACRRRWALSLGYAAMIAACLVPGLAGFLQPTPGAPPLYGPDGGFLALASGLLLALGQEDSLAGRTPRRLLVSTWAVWLLWILLSVLLARHPAAPLAPPDPSLWDLP
jgi:hypothetical protein